MAVAGLECFVDRLTDLTRGRLPGPESQLAARELDRKFSDSTDGLKHIRDLVAGVESDLFAERHCGMVVNGVPRGGRWFGRMNL